jgi:predicted alpha/beta-hydrolase family hydrolase
MSTTEAANHERFRVDISPTEHVTAVAYRAAVLNRVDIALVLAHGAGANQTNGFMVQFATALAARGIDTVTFNFLYTEEHKRVPDRNDKLERCYRRLIDAVRGGELGFAPPKLAIGGKSMGGRIASQVAAADGDGIAGLVFLGYPLHPPGREDQLRTGHWPAITTPMLFVQGSRDAFGTPEELRPILKKLKIPAELYEVAGGDHSFKVPKSAGAAQADVYKAIQDRIDAWLRAAIAI